MSLAHFCFNLPLVRFQSPLISSVFISLIGIPVGGFFTPRPENFFFDGVLFSRHWMVRGYTQRPGATIRC